MVLVIHSPQIQEVRSLLFAILVNFNSCLKRSLCSTWFVSARDADTKYIGRQGTTLTLEACRSNC